MSTASTVQNNGAQFAMISLAALQNSKLAGEFICEIDSANCTETITYFQQAQNFTSSFACFTQSLQNQGTTSISAPGGGETLFNISRVGDVLLGLTAVITLPRLYSKISVTGENETTASGYQCAWVKNVGHHVINKCELLAQDTVIESFGNVGTGAPGGGVYGAFMDCHMGMTNTTGKAHLYDTMIGNRPELINLAIRPNHSSIPGDNVIYCPLQLSFCAKNDSGVPAAPLPVCALAYCTLQVKIGLNKFTDVAIQAAQSHVLASGLSIPAGQNITGTDLTTVVQAADDSQLESQTVVQADTANVGVDGNYGVQMLAEYAMVSSQERAALACAKTTQHVLHRQAHAHVWKPGQNHQLTTTITFSGCNAYWWSLFQNTGLKFTSTGAVPGVDIAQSGSLYSSNYTSGYQCALEEGIVGPIQTSALSYVQGASGQSAVVDVGVNPIGNIKINADSSPILDVSNHITAWYNWWWKTNNSGCDGVSTGMNLIPFCLTTEFYAIEANGGFLNLSKLTNVTETVTLAKEPRNASGPALGPATMNSGTLSTHTGLVAAPPTSQEYPLRDTTTAANIPQTYNHYVLSVAYNSIVVSGGTLQHPYY